MRVWRRSLCGRQISGLPKYFAFQKFKPLFVLDQSMLRRWCFYRMERLRPYFTRLCLSKLINTNVEGRHKQMQLDLNDVSRGRESTFPSLPLGVSTEQTSNINEGRGQGHWREHIPPGTAAARPQESGIKDRKEGLSQLIFCFFKKRQRSWTLSEISQCSNWGQQTQNCFLLLCIFNVPL